MTSRFLPTPSGIQPILLLCGLLIAAPVGNLSPAWAETANPARGKAAAARWCGQCHLVSPDQTRTATDAAPPFAELANNPGMTRTRLLSILGNPHGRMPTGVLSRRDINDVIAHIESLRK